MKKFDSAKMMEDELEQVVGGDSMLSSHTKKTER